MIDDIDSGVPDSVQDANQNASDPTGSPDSASLPAESAGSEAPDTQQGDALAADLVFQGFSQAVHGIGQPEHLEAAQSWLQELRGLDAVPESVSIRHDFNFDAAVVDDGDLPLVHSFLNKMADAGATQAFIDKALAWYAALPVGENDAADPLAVAEAGRQIEAQDLSHRDATRDAMHEQWGQVEYSQNVALINRHLDTMPTEQREWYEGRDENGALRLNNPAILDRLAREARASVPSSLAAAAREYGSEKSAIEYWMADRSSPYWKGPDAARIQARYRDLIAAGNTTPAPKVNQTVESELAKIETVMRTDRRRYNSDEGMQQRYRELLMQRQ